MDEDLKKALLDTLNDARSAAEQGKNFVLEQAPLVVQEYIAYVRIESTIWLAVSLVWALVVAFSYWRWWRRGPKLFAYGCGEPSVHDVGFARFVGAMIAFLMLLPVAITVQVKASTCIKSWVAPRVLIIEKAADLIK